MRTIIIDDEPKSRNTIKNYIAKYAPALEIIGEGDSVKTGSELIETKKPDLVFLDVEMGDGTGFDLLGLITHTDFKLIFCTSHEKYAIKAFRFSAIDYLLKPVDPDIFQSAINKVTSGNISAKTQLEILKTNQSEFKRIALSTSEGITLVDIDSIIRMESNSNYTSFFLENNSLILASKTLKEFDDLLSESGFIRIHKSHLVNAKFIMKYIKGDGGWIVMSDGSKVEVSRRKKDILLQFLTNIQIV